MVMISLAHHSEIRSMPAHVPMINDGNGPSNQGSHGPATMYNKYNSNSSHSTVIAATTMSAVDNTKISGMANLDSPTLFCNTHQTGEVCAVLQNRVR